MHHAFSGIFVAIDARPQRETTNFTSVYAGRERWQDNDCTSLFMNLGRIFENSTPEKLANILQTEAEDERTALKFKTAWTHFLSECCYVATAALIHFKTVEARGGEIVGGKT